MTTTIVVPTFDHGPMLRYSVGTALVQTDADVEVLIIGDGVPDSAREVALELQRGDERVRFFDYPKGPGNGEAYRNDVLRDHARGDVVCYLSDDDLWTPDHVATMRELLCDADFAHATPVVVTPGGLLHDLRCDLSRDHFRLLLLSGENRIPLSCGAHTAEAFARLRIGWQLPPPGSWGDLTFWQQFLADPTARLASSFKPTVLHFPSPERREWTPGDRMEELERWRVALSRPSWRSDLDATLLAAALRDADELDASLAIAIGRYRDLLESAIARSELYESELLATRGTLWWQLHVRLTRHRVAARAARAASRVARAAKRGLRR